MGWIGDLRQEETGREEGERVCLGDHRSYRLCSVWVSPGLALATRQTGHV